MSGYSIPASESEVELHAKNSRFIGTARAAATVDEARAFIASVRERFSDASHHCYAFAAGYGATVIHGMSDDGEPWGTAGKPMLAVVQGCGLGDVVVVATRYFGGTKLGTGGLVKAYTETAQAAIAAVDRVDKVELVGVTVTLGYDAYQVCKREIEALGAVVEAEDFNTQVQIELRLDANRYAVLRATLIEMTSGRVQVELLD